MSVHVAGTVLRVVAKQIWPWAAAQILQVTKLRGTRWAVPGQRYLQGGRLPQEGGRLHGLPPSRPALDRANPRHSALLKFFESSSTTT